MFLEIIYPIGIYLTHFQCMVDLIESQTLFKELICIAVYVARSENGNTERVRSTAVSFQLWYNFLKFSLTASYL